MHVNVIVGLAAAGVIGAAPAAQAMSAGRPAKAGNSAKARGSGTSFFGATTPLGGVAIVLSRNRRRMDVLFAYQTTCTSGITLSTYDTFAKVPVSAGRTFNANRDSGPQTDPKSPGETVRATRSISGAISKRGSKIMGTARSTVTITKAAGLITCDTGPVPFTADH